MNALEKLRSVVEQIRHPRDPLQLLDHWQLAGRLLARFPVDQQQAAAVCRERNVAALDALVTSIEQSDPRADRRADPPVSQAEMDAALRAFRKRLKLARLADESRLGGRYTSSGRHSGIDAILPPDQFAPHVWRALERAGRIRHTGQGFYALP